MAPDSAAPAPATTRREHAAVVAAAVSYGVSGYLVLVIAARTLTTAENSHFLVFWGALFTFLGTLTGLAAEGTRAIHSASVAPTPAGPGVSVMRVALWLGAALAAAVAVTAPWWAEAVFGGDAQIWSALLVVGILLFTVHAGLVGIAAGRGHWTTYSLLLGIEPLGRLVLVTVVALAAAQTLGLAAAAALASGYWVLLALLGRPDLGWRTIAPGLDARGLGGRMVSACAAAAASAVLLVGFPVLVQISSSDAEVATAAPLVLAVSLCRAPLMVPLGIYQNVIITKVIAHGLAALRAPAAFVAVGTAAGVVGAWLIGPWCLRLVNPDYDVSGATLALLVLSAGMVCVLYLTGAAALALDHHRVYVAGWLVATLAVLLVLLGPGDLTTRTVLSLLVGPPLGVAVHLGGLRLSTPRVTGRLPARGDG